MSPEAASGVRLFPNSSRSFPLEGSSCSVEEPLTSQLWRRCQVAPCFTSMKRHALLCGVVHAESSMMLGVSWVLRWVVADAKFDLACLADRLFAGRPR